MSKLSSSNVWFWLWPSFIWLSLVQSFILYLSLSFFSFISGLISCVIFFGRLLFLTCILELAISLLLFHLCHCVFEWSQRWWDVQRQSNRLDSLQFHRNTLASVWDFQLLFSKPRSLVFSCLNFWLPSNVSREMWPKQFTLNGHTIDVWTCGKHIHYIKKLS